MVPVEFDLLIFKENETYIAYCPELDISSCGDSIEHARQMLKEAVRLFLKEAESMGTLNDILEEANFKTNAKGEWIPPQIVATELAKVA